MKRCVSRPFEFTEEIVSMDHDVSQVDQNAYIAPNAVIVGDVSIGSECTVLFNVTLRGDGGGRIVIEDGSNIQENCCLHVDRGGLTHVGRGVTVGHGAILHGCSIGDGSMVGMGAIVIDGARIGKNCLIGAGSLVTGTADVPDGMLVIGSPAKAVRPLREEELAMLSEAASEYVNTGRKLAEQGVLGYNFTSGFTRSFEKGMS